MNYSILYCIFKGKNFRQIATNSRAEYVSAKTPVRQKFRTSTAFSTNQKTSRSAKITELVCDWLKKIVEAGKYFRRIGCTEVRSWPI
jgi:hypothetical protein